MIAMSLVKVFMTKCPVTDLDDLECPITREAMKKCLENHSVVLNV